eukprot:26888-Alexandrium_andersonii.AAC.1
MFLAMAALASAWGWELTAFLLLAGFRGRLRPGEIAALRRGHIAPRAPEAFGGCHRRNALRGPATRGPPPG